MLHITTHGGKLDGMHSISSSVALNPICAERAKNPESVCAKCYAARYVGMRRELREALERNTNELDALIPMDELPAINDKLFRIESFGDTRHETQAANYYRLALKNDGTTFAAWTKNVKHYEDAHEHTTRKPNNFILIYSDPIINGHPDEWYDAFLAAHPLVDKIFTVYDKAHAPSVAINCGKRHCLNCQICYHKGGPRIMREVLK